MAPPIRHVNRHQGLEESSVVRHPQVKELVRDNEVLEPRFLVG
jgi:hypothetical protein